MKFAPKKHTDTATTADVAETPTTETVEATTSTTPTETVEDSRPEPVSRVATRPRVMRTMLLLAAFTAGAGSTFVATRSTTSAAPPAAAGADLETPSLTPSASAPDIVAASLDAALAYRSEYGTFVGFTRPDVRVATATNVVLLASEVNSICAFSKIIDGVVYEVATDPTRETCAQATIDAAQQVLDANTSTAAKETAVALAGSINAVAQAATLWASMSYDASGRPSLLGLRDLQVPGSKVIAVSPNGQTATVQVIADGSCVLVVVSAQVQTAPPTTPCS